MSYRLALAILCCLPLASASADATLTGWMADPELPEISGMAASHAHPGSL